MPTGMTHVCEQCHRATELIHCKSVDEYLCEECIMALAIAYYEANGREECDEINTEATP
jgi:hypothetical protein